MERSDNYHLLIEKLDQFIRKYYLNQIIRGLLYSVGVVVLLFLVMALMEYYYYFSPAMRKGMLFSFFGISLLALGGWVLLPLARYFNLGKVISHEQAASIIGNHFSNVEDKLLNILQLREQVDKVSNKDLILASVDQKSESIKLVPFKNAIDLGSNRKYLRYALPPLLLLLLILLASPNLITDSTNRLIRNNEYFEKPAPFSFVVNEEELSVVQFEDYPLTVVVDGEALPNEVFIEVDNYQYRLVKEDERTFSYTFNNVQKETNFQLLSGGVESKPFTLDVLAKPNILGFEVELDYPSYTGRKDESLNNIGDLVVPVGSKIDWVFNSQNTDDISVQFSSEQEAREAKRFSDELFTLDRRAMKDETYKLFVSNDDLPNADSIAYTLTVIPDQYPSINVEKYVDSLDSKLLFFVGDASDDYGLSSLTFNYRIQDANGETGELISEKMSHAGGKKIQYTHTWDVALLELEPGEKITYYFEIFDNDGVNGSKSSRTSTMIYAMPTVDEFEDMNASNNEEIKDRLQKALEENRKIQEEMKKLREELLQEKELDWQKRKELEKLVERQKELQKEINRAKQAFEENMKNQQEYTETEENIQEKQEKLQEMFDNAMDEEMQELMEKIEELMEELEKDGALEMMEEFEFSDEEMEKQLDRMLELFKQLELEHEWEKTIDQLEELAEKQEELSEQTEGEEKPQEELEEEQEKINEEFKELEEKVEDLFEKNKELEQPKSLGDEEEQKEEMEDIEEDLQDSQEQLQQQQNKNASQKQKDAAKKMRDMAQGMSMQMQSQAMEQMQEDMEALRQLLENLVALSFDQEDLIGDFGEAEVNTPRYIDLVQQQFKLKDDFRLIEDSLQALSKRVFQIESFINEKVTDINYDMKQSIEDLEERRKPQASDHQQRVMKSVNDLALMLSETMNQMQQQMAGMMSGSQMCNKPGGSGGKSGNVPKDKISEGQKKLNEEMKKMSEKMKEQGKGKGKGEGVGSEEFAKMAARQAALRRALREKQKQLQQQGKGSKELQEMIDQMNKVETDLVNKRLTNELLRRQEEIMTRLLEHEKAERQREYDNKRKSEVATQYERKLPPSLEEYIRKREAEIELYRTVSPSLKPYYKILVEEYYKGIRN